MLLRSHVILIFLSGISLAVHAQDNSNSAFKQVRDSETTISVSEEANSSVNTGRDYHGKASYDDALKSYFDALAIYEDLPDSSKIATTLTLIGQTYLRLGKNSEAGEVFNRSLQISTILNDKQGIQISTADMAVVLQRNNQTHEAIKLYKEALILAREVSNLREEAIITGNIGSTYRRQGTYDSSTYYLLKALPLKVQLGNGTSTAHTLNDIAETYLDQGDYNNAVTYAQMALDTAALAGAVSQGSFARFTLSRAYAAQEKYEAAYSYLKDYKQLSDSINSVAKDRTISDLRLKYETGKKEQKITELAAENLVSQQRRRNLLIALLVVIILAMSVTFVFLTKRKHNLAMLAKKQELQNARSRFFTNISHEFRTPLTLILGPLHALRDKFKGTETEAKLSGMQQNAGRLLRLIDRMLDLSRIDDHRLILTVSEVNANDNLKDIMSTIEHAALEQKITLVFEPGDDPIPLYLDRDRFDSIILNLLSNALKYSATGDVITIRAKQVDSSQVQIEIQDTGEGIESEDLPHIFERYHHNDTKSKSSIKGVGVGLSLCKSLVELHGGNISVQSEPGVGATFTIQFLSGKEHLEGRDDIIFSQADTLNSASDMTGFKNMTNTAVRPTKSSPDSQNEVKPFLLSSVPAGVPSIQGAEAPDVQNDVLRKILIVEDRHDMRAFIKEILDPDFDIVEAGDGQQGLHLAQDNIPDLIISDVMMPKLEGTELCARLKKDPLTSHIPVILLTAKSSDQDRLAGLETEADVYLTKPFIPKELVLNIRNLLNSRNRIHKHYALNGKLNSREISTNTTDNTFLTHLAELLQTHHADSGFSVGQLADAAHMSRSQLHRKLTALTGQAPTSVIRRFRLQRARELVGASAGSVSEIAFEVGFSSSSYFIKCFQKEFGMSPGEMKAEN